jgi:O-antigen ligase
MYRKIIRWWLIGILFFFPFRKVIAIYFEGINLTQIKYANYLDEFTIVLFLVPAVIELYRRNNIQYHLYLIILMPILVFCLFGLTSGIVNGNPVIVNILGTFDYVKYFFIIFIYAAYFREFSDFDKIFRFMLILAIFFSFTAIIEEAWVLVSRYILGKDILDPSMYLFRPQPPSEEASLGAWRYGIYRAGSIIKKVNWLGHYSLFILTVYMFVKKKCNPYIIFLLVSGILFTVSRTSYAGLLVMSIVFIISRKVVNRKLVLTFITIIIIAITFLGLNTSSIYKLNPRGKGVVTYRDYAAGKCIEVWKDHPFIGVGPGMFGGVVSMKFASPVYKEYNYPIGRLKSIGGIDQFWPQVIAETGIIGLGLFVCLILALLKLLLLLRQDSIRDDIKRLLSGLLLFLFSIYISTFGRGFNEVVTMFPYFAFVGISLGSINKLKRNDISLHGN